MAREAVSRVAGSIELRSAATMAEVRKKAVHGPLAVPFARLAADGPERRIDVVTDLDVPPETARALSSSAAYALSAITGLMFRAGATGRVPTMHLRGRERVEAIELVGVEPSPGPIALGAGCALDEGGCLERALRPAQPRLSPLRTTCIRA